ncbi:MAG: DUF86 domain-containing protein [Dehalococcoidia bacterium]
MRRRRTYRDYIRDMLAYAQRAQEFVGSADLEQFRQQQQTVLAVTRALEVVGEAARQLPAALRQRYPEVPWSKAIGMRNILIHAYFGVDEEVLWRTVLEDLPPLREALERMLQNLEGGLCDA